MYPAALSPNALQVARPAGVQVLRATSRQASHRSPRCAPVRHVPSFLLLAARGASPRTCCSRPAALIAAPPLSPVVSPRISYCYFCFDYVSLPGRMIVSENRLLYMSNVVSKAHMLTIHCNCFSCKTSSVWSFRNHNKITILTVPI